MIKIIRVNYDTKEDRDENLAYLESVKSDQAFVRVGEICFNRDKIVYARPGWCKEKDKLSFQSIVAFEDCEKATPKDDG